jgi:hypothetical protein
MKNGLLLLLRCGVLGICGLLLFWRLGHYALWDDEALTALIGKGILATGDTSIYVGENVVAFRDGLMVRDGKDRITPPMVWRRDMGCATAVCDCGAGVRGIGLMVGAESAVVATVNFIYGDFGKRFVFFILSSSAVLWIGFAAIGWDQLFIRAMEKGMEGASGDFTAFCGIVWDAYIGVFGISDGAGS